MNLLKTAQLNVGDILKYLNHETLQKEKIQFNENSRTCGGMQINARLKQNWITGAENKNMTEPKNVQ